MNSFYFKCSRSSKMSIVYQDLVKINKACESGEILNNKEVIKAYSYARDNGKKLHLMGLTSTGGVHSSLDHLFKLIEIGKEYGLTDKVFVHCFMDGRDTDPKSGKGFTQAYEIGCAFIGPLYKRVDVDKIDVFFGLFTVVARFVAHDAHERFVGDIGGDFVIGDDVIASIAPTVGVVLRGADDVDLFAIDFGSSTEKDSISVCSCNASVRPGIKGTFILYPHFKAACSMAAHPPSTIISAKETFLFFECALLNLF